MKQWYDFHIVLKSLFGQATLDRWLSGIGIEKYDARNIYLIASDSFQIDWFNEHIRPIASKRLLNHQNRPYKVYIRQRSEKIVKPKKTSKIVTSSNYWKLPISKNFTFDNFITTESTLLTTQVLKQLTKSLSSKTQNISLDANPILIVGETGSGKTHLLQALYTAFKENSYNPLYVSTSVFTDHFVKALRANDMLHFREFYRSFDALIVDNVEILSRKIATQEEFFHTFNTYHSLGKPIILSSSISPKTYTEIEPRLISRFEWGLVLSLKALSSKEFQNYISVKCSELNLKLDNISINYLLSKVTHIQDLAKILQMLSFKQDLSYQNKDMSSLNDIKDIIEKVLERSKQTFSNEKVLMAVSNYFQIPKESLVSSSKTKQLVYPRRLSMYLMRSYGKKPFAQIGRFFSKDHSTVMTSYEYIAKKLKEHDQSVQNDLKEVVVQIKKKPN